jgi:hypothetical protein
MRYKVIFLKPKKKRGFFSIQEATFFDIESAFFYQTKMEQLGSKDFKIIPI